MMKGNKQVLVTSISNKVPLVKAVKSAAEKIGGATKVFGADTNSLCIARHFVDHFWRMPPLDQLVITQLIDYCNEHDIHEIIPTRDGELLYFAKYKGVLQDADIHVMVSEKDKVETCIDKLVFAQSLSHKGYPVIQTEASLVDIPGDHIVVKERFGAGSENIGFKLSRSSALLHAENLKAPVYQPFIQGKELSVDVYIDLKGQVKGTIARTRDIVVNGESQITTTLRHPKVEQICSDIARDLNLYGHNIFQIFIDEQQEVQIIEVNCRFGGASTLSLSAGLDSFYWFLLESRGEDLNGYPFLRSSKEKRQIRFAEDIVI